MSYLDKIRFAVRRSPSEEVDGELKDLIEACRRDLIQKGVPAGRVYAEDDALVLGAVRCYVRWQFGIGGDDAERNRDDYCLMADQLRRAVEQEEW